MRRQSMQKECKIKCKNRKEKKIDILIQEIEDE